MNFAEGQIHWLNALILKKHATIISGAYKSRVVYHGTSTDESKRLTEEELLQNELQAMDQQIKWLDDSVQALSKGTEATSNIHKETQRSNIQK